jgi:transposase
MANSFLPVDRDQQFLLPHDMAEWLGSDHQVWFVVEAVDCLDLSEFIAGYRLGGVGRRGYDPAMLLTLWIYALAVGVRTSREIERRCRTDAAFRVICGTWGAMPDHATLCRFRRRHRDAVKGLFLQVLGLAEEVGMTRLGVVGVDGTKIAAQASLGSNRTEEWIRDEVGRLFEEAEAAEQVEEAEMGDDAGWRLPPELGDRDRRARRLGQLEEALGRFDRSGEDETVGQVTAVEESVGEEPDTENKEEEKKPRVNVTDPDSSIMMTAKGGYIQAYNCQVVATEDGLVVAASVSGAANDLGQLSTMLEATDANLEAIGVTERPEVVLADAGYFDSADLASIEDADDAPLLLVATRKRRNQPTGPSLDDPQAVWEEKVAVFDAEDETERQRRAVILQRWEDGDYDAGQAASVLGLKVPQTYAARDTWRRGGIDAIPVPKRQRPIKPKPSQVVRHRLETRLGDDANKELYKKRSHIAETPFARLKDHQQLHRFARRGLNAVTAEFLLDCVVHNLLRIWHHTTTPNPAPA